MAFSAPAPADDILASTHALLVIESAMKFWPSAFSSNSFSAAKRSTMPCRIFRPARSAAALMASAAGDWLAPTLPSSERWSSLRSGMDAARGKSLPIALSAVCLALSMALPAMSAARLNRMSGSVGLNAPVFPVALLIWVWSLTMNCRASCHFSIELPLAMSSSVILKNTSITLSGPLWRSFALSCASSRSSVKKAGVLNVENSFASVPWYTTSGLP